MYERILVAMDGSEVSQAALREAVSLARGREVALCVVHGIDAVTTNAYKRSDFEEFLAPQIEAGRALLEAATALAKQAGVVCEERLLKIDAIGRHRLPEAVAAEAEAWGADLIVVGTHGRRGVSHLLLGSVSDGIVHLAGSPVLVVADTAGAASATDRPLARLLVAVDASEASRGALQQAIALARSCRLALRVVHAQGAKEGVAGEGEDLLRAAREAAAAAGVEVQAEALPAGPVAEAVAADAAAWSADLVVVGTHGRRGLERLRLGSVAEAILRQAPVPVLLVRADAGAAAG